MRATWVVLCGSIAASGCIVVANPDNETPSRFITEVGPRVGIASIDEAATDGATGPGAIVGLRAGVLYRATPRLAAGLALDFALSGHDTPVEKRSASYWSLMLPVAAVRYDLGRFAVSSWAGYYIGFRSISEPGGAFGNRVYSSEKLAGASATVAALVRTGLPLEVGPYAQLQWLYSREDDTRTPDFNEDGMRIRSLSVGIMLQGAFGAPSISGNADR